MKILTLKDNEMDNFNELYDLLFEKKMKEKEIFLYRMLPSVEKELKRTSTTVVKFDVYQTKDLSKKKWLVNKFTNEYWEILTIEDNSDPDDDLIKQYRLTIKTDPNPPTAKK